ncbi:hypothetical protein [Enterococcus mediterraneensis]|uniref:hypothetical protein n=1 Tax=Enterococcus mediterraneensis TaxID=2364791 RepID=UPI001F15129F|nr:hypothetical protein [Enterococcus mediterraneensis]
MLKIYYNNQSAIVADEKNRTFRHASLEEARLLKGHSSYRAELHYVEEYFLNIGYREPGKEKDLLEIFWSNVDWHRENKKMTWTELISGNTVLAKNKKLNATLKTVQEIAKALDIDDYAILFEEV